MNALKPFAVVLLAAMLLSPAGATAQRGKLEPKAEAAEPPPVQPSGAPFMQPLSRLATILGSMHFLRELCGDANAALWRDQMNALIEAQAPNEADRALLVASFNGGYRSFASVYRRCTPAALAAAERYRVEGADLSRDIAMRYGN